MALLEELGMIYTNLVRTFFPYEIPYVLLGISISSGLR